jgi:hypothetical protein
MKKMLFAVATVAIVAAMGSMISAPAEAGCHSTGAVSPFSHRPIMSCDSERERLVSQSMCRDNAFHLGHLHSDCSNQFPGGGIASPRVIRARGR